MRIVFADDVVFVFSTSVEVFPMAYKHGVYVSGLLHVRGGVSAEANMSLTTKKSSPRPWRCFRPNRCVSAVDDVFSTSVEVFLRKSLKNGV